MKKPGNWPWCCRSTAGTSELRSESSVDPTPWQGHHPQRHHVGDFGTGAVAGFMIIYYLFAGFVADSR